MTSSRTEKSEKYVLYKPWWLSQEQQINKKSTRLKKNAWELYKEQTTFLESGRFFPRKISFQVTKSNKQTAMVFMFDTVFTWGAPKLYEDTSKNSVFFNKRRKEKNCYWSKKRVYCHTNFFKYFQSKYIEYQITLPLFGWMVFLKCQVETEQHFFLIRKSAEKSWQAGSISRTSGTKSQFRRRQDSGRASEYR